jgi:regulator of CtrA degradation
MDETVAEDSNTGETVELKQRLVSGGGFNTLYREGMGLIEEVAAYLDGDGRAASRSLTREASFVYATESMRLTTRLMQLASWLLLQRAVNEGEISPETAREEKSKVRFSPSTVERGGPGWEELPPMLLSYISEGERLFDRVQHFDRLDRGDPPPKAPEDETRSISAQMSRLRAAFGQSVPEK